MGGGGGGGGGGGSQYLEGKGDRKEERKLGPLSMKKQEKEE